jgi:siroheme synthase (precorrin-2 oxidase/ferrochelatase)
MHSASIGFCFAKIVQAETRQVFVTTRSDEKLAKDEKRRRFMNDELESEVMNDVSHMRIKQYDSRARG